MKRFMGYEILGHEDGYWLDREEVLTLLRAIRDEASRSIEDSGAQFENADRIEQLRGGLERIAGMVEPEL